MIIAENPNNPYDVYTATALEAFMKRSNRRMPEHPLKDFTCQLTDQQVIARLIYFTPETGKQNNGEFEGVV